MAADEKQVVWTQSVSEQERERKTKCLSSTMDTQFPNEDIYLYERNKIIEK